MTSDSKGSDGLSQHFRLDITEHTRDKIKSRGTPQVRVERQPLAQESPTFKTLDFNSVKELRSSRPDGDTNANL